MDGSLKKMRFLLFLFLITVCSGWLLFFSTAGKTALKAVYAHNRIIVKFREDSPLNKAVLELFTNQQSFSTLIKDVYLDQLNKQYGVIKISRVSKDPRSVEEIKAKFPEREVRAPKNYPMPLIQNIYIFEFDQDHEDILQICRAYTQSPHVEYARPNYYAKISDE